jgi:AcrR family transcriptional regulator
MTMTQASDDGPAGRRPGAALTARQRARDQITREIKEEARRQLAAQGAQRLSLRAVARELGMVSSALYRYFPSRDDLLTALIIDAYDALGASAEAAVARRPGAGGRARWRACCHAIRDWAIASPHEYALIYGSPVPGYQAPPETIDSAARVAVAFAGILAGAPLRSPGPDDDRPLPGLLAGQAEKLSQDIARAGAPPAPASARLAPGVPPPVMARALVAWTQLFGMISFELFGQLVGSADPADDFFGYAVEQMADFVGLPA